MNAFNFGQLVKQAAEPMDAVKQLQAQRVAQMKAMAAKVRQASGNPAGQAGNGTNKWTGVVRGGNVQDAQHSFTPGSPAAGAAAINSNLSKMTPPPAARPQPKAAPALGTQAMNRMFSPLQSSPQPNVTTTKVDTADLQKQLQQAQQQSAPPPAPPAPPSPVNQPAMQPPQQPNAAGGQSMWQKMKGYIPGSSAWTGQTGAPAAGPLAAPMSNVSTAFNNATGGSDPAHIITTDNGRKFNTQTKTFLDGRPGGFAR